MLGGLVAPGIPDLDLRAAAEIDAAVAVGVDLPIDPEFEVAEVAVGGEKGLVAVADDFEAGVGFLNAPMGVEAGLHFVVPGLEFVALEGGDLTRVAGRAAAPGGAVFEIDERLRAGGVALVCAVASDANGPNAATSAAANHRCSFIEVPPPIPQWPEAAHADAATLVTG